MTKSNSTTEGEAVQHTVHALAGLRVLDCSGELGAYGCKLFASLGAEVISVCDVNSPDDPARIAYNIWMQASKKLMRLDLTQSADRLKLRELATSADLVMDQSPDSLLRLADISDQALLSANPAIVITRVAPLGVEGPDAGRRSSDLTLLARSGLMWLAGEPGMAPVRPAANQSAIATGLYAGIGALMALLHAQASGHGQIVDVSALEVMATALENAPQYWDLERTIRKRTGSAPRESATGLFTCLDGFVYVMAGRLSTPRGWVSLVEWLIETDTPGATQLLAPEWSTYAHRIKPESTAICNEVLGRFTARLGKAFLYEEGQRRGIVVCPLNTPLDLLLDKQLLFRNFFVPIVVQDSTQTVQVPRGPFTLSATPVHPPQAAREISAYSNWATPKRTPVEKPPATGEATLPLAGVRVIDFTWVGAGPYSTKLLADHGAEVIKIESTSRVDVLRITPPFFEKISGLNRSGYFANRNTSKKSITLNLSDPQGIELARALIKSADIVTNSFAPGAMEKWGLGYEGCRALREDIIYLSMPMHASGGPHSHFAGFGAAIGALSSIYAATGYPGRDPVGTGTNYPDHVPNPTHAALGVLAALYHRRQTGQGQAIELSQVESTICALAPLLIDAQLRSKDPEYVLRIANRQAGVAPHGVYPAQGEDRWIAIACWNQQDWENLARISGQGWDVDPQFKTLALRLKNQDALDEKIARWTTSQQAPVLAGQLQEQLIDAACVQNAQDVIEFDPQLAHLGHWVKLKHPEMGETIYDNPPIHFSRTPGSLHACAPLLGQHTEQVCATILGLGHEQISQLRELGIFK